MQKDITDQKVLKNNLIIVDDNKIIAQEIKMAILSSQVLSEKLDVFVITNDNLAKISNGPKNLRMQFKSMTVQDILEFKPDIITLDVQFNRDKNSISGMDIAKTLKSDESTKHIPIIMLSLMSHLKREAEKNALCDIFLTKPCPEYILIENIIKILEKQDS
jgi:CheY-like chemotaxis protein